MKVLIGLGVIMGILAFVALVITWIWGGSPTLMKIEGTLMAIGFLAYMASKVP